MMKSHRVVYVTGPFTDGQQSETTFPSLRSVIHQQWEAIVVQNNPQGHNKGIHTPKLLHKLLFLERYALHAILALKRN